MLPRRHAPGPAAPSPPRFSGGEDASARRKEQGRQGRARAIPQVQPRRNGQSRLQSEGVPGRAQSRECDGHARNEGRGFARGWLSARPRRSLLCLPGESHSSKGKSRALPRGPSPSAVVQRPQSGGGGAAAGATHHSRTSHRSKRCPLALALSGAPARF